MNKQIEILSPGGDKDAVKAAILAGADAVYMGLKKFNARKRAENITEEELQDLINIAHNNNSKIFITMNILLTQEEVPEALNYASELISLGVDAIIVQDAGFAYLLNSLFPDLEIHASTQMTTHNSLQINYLKKFNFHQVNFARELSALEIKPLIEHSHKNKIKTEIFVHGAYCISCSGVCYMSAAISAQPGNRGACLQPCRRQYSTESKSEKEYLLSLKDNNALDHTEELINAGADTLKIEGRIKNFNYVYQVTNAWRQQVDYFLLNQEIEGDPSNQVKNVFNRDFSAGYYESKISSQMFVDSPLDQSYQLIGKVDSYFAKKNELTLQKNFHIANGSRINIYTAGNSFICGSLIENKISKNTYKIKIENQLKGKILKDQIILLLNNENELNELKSKIDKLIPVQKKLNIKVSGKLSEKLKAEFSIENKVVEVFSQSNLTSASKNSLDIETLKKQFGRLGSTPFELGEVFIEGLEANLFLPVKELNVMRREAIEYFSPSNNKFNFSPPSTTKNKFSKKLCLLISQKEDLNFIDKNFDGLIFLDTTTSSRPEDFSENIYPWLPSFILDNEIDYYKNLLEKINPQFVISDNSGLGNWCGENNISWIAGPQLNCSNSYSFEAYQKLGKASGGFYSTEINKDQINSFSVPENFSTFYSVFGNILLMTTRQCLFQKPNLCKQGKTETDEKCLNGCVNYTPYYDEKNTPFHIMKSLGHLNRIYNDAQLFIPEALNQINSDFYVLDFRSFPFIKFSSDEKKKIFNLFNSTLLNGKTNNSNLNEVKQLIGKITRGNYLRGFE